MNKMTACLISMAAFIGCTGCGSPSTEQDVAFASAETEKMTLHRSLAGRIEGDIHEGLACIRYVSVADPDMESGKDADLGQGPSVRLSTCDGRLIAQLSGGFVPQEWRRAHTPLALLSRQERELLGSLRKNVQAVAANDSTADLERLLILLNTASTPSSADTAFIKGPDINDASRPNAVLVASRPDAIASEDVDNWLWSGKSKREGHPRFWRHGWKFRQSIQLWSKKTDIRGFETHDDHSGSIQRIFGQSFDGRQTDMWHYISCNHGTCPREGKMQPYAECNPGVWTENWYSYDAECLGWWGFSHVCNDDTALQINGAYGKWNGKDCKGTKRPNRPWCGIHWE